MSASRTLRDRQAVHQFDADRAHEHTPYGSAAILATTTTVTTYPTSAGAYYAANPSQCSGNEVEGGAVTYVDTTGTVIYAWNAGTAIPPSGTTFVCHAVGGRYVFRYDG